MPHRRSPRSPTRCRAALLALLLTAGAASCISVGVRPDGPGRQTASGTVREPRIPRTAGEPQTTERSGDPSAALARRRVVAKEPPVSLVSSDGLRCHVSAERFECVKLDDQVLCVWTKPNEEGEQPRTP